MSFAVGTLLQGAEIALFWVSSRTMLGAWLTELLTGPLSKLKEPCDGVAKLHAFVGKTNELPQFVISVG